MRWKHCHSKKAVACRTHSRAHTYSLTGLGQLARYRVCNLTLHTHMHTASQGLRSLQGTRARSHAASQDLRSLQDRVRALEVQVARNEAAAARVPGLEAQVCVCMCVCARLCACRDGLPSVQRTCCWCECVLLCKLGGEKEGLCCLICALLVLLSPMLCWV